MSTQKGNIKKKGQKYQNDTKFQHNKKSKKTEKILQTPLDHLCQRCLDILQWKIDYRKYKPLTALAKCNTCLQRCINKAYRMICEKCAEKPTAEGVKQLLCTKCGKDTLTEGGVGYAEQALTSKAQNEQQAKLESDMEETLKTLKERCKRTVLRKIDTGEVTYDPIKKIFIYKDTDEEYKVGEKRDGDKDSDDDSENDSNDDENSDKDKDDDSEEEKKESKEKIKTQPAIITQKDEVKEEDKKEEEKQQ
ncbi:UNKNOWN [Stylonychia lemnae]|uniref:Uncharacterized protein n=1 Tax=Stylonychia lemnae TaxID=5949 RepID=A0A078ATW8_STYLE|nr:UNKNOWN [Stylonychia lemnae]|eukprot:CDW84687.1 UNKNOWN [Stylonychia lemnae]